MIMTYYEYALWKGLGRMTGWLHLPETSLLSLRANFQLTRRRAFSSPSCLLRLNWQVSEGRSWVELESDHQTSLDRKRQSRRKEEGQQMWMRGRSEDTYIDAKSKKWVSLPLLEPTPNRPQQTHPSAPATSNKCGKLTRTHSSPPRLSHLSACHIYIWTAGPTKNHKQPHYKT
jgi:hypothetical protein